MKHICWVLVASLVALVGCNSVSKPISETELTSQAVVDCKYYGNIWFADLISENLVPEIRGGMSAECMFLQTWPDVFRMHTHLEIKTTTGWQRLDSSYGKNIQLPLNSTGKRMSLGKIFTRSRCGAGTWRLVTTIVAADDNSNVYTRGPTIVKTFTCK